jgi:hypothetical protein
MCTEYLYIVNGSICSGWAESSVERPETEQEETEGTEDGTNARKGRAKGVKRRRV